MPHILRAVFVRAVMALLSLGLVAVPASAADSRPEFKVAWSIYVGWMPWDYAEQSGILKKWAENQAKLHAAPPTLQP